LLERLRALPSEERAELLLSELQARIAERLGVDRGEVEARGPLMQLGLSSLRLMELKAELDRELALTLKSSVLFDYPTLERLVPFLLARAGLLPAREASPPSPAGPRARAVESSLFTEASIEAALASELASLEKLGGP